MGGSLTTKYALSYANGLAGLGVMLAGIMPIYPGESSRYGVPADDYVSARGQPARPYSNGDARRIGGCVDGRIYA